jgi:hypothetical protein
MYNYFCLANLSPQAGCLLALDELDPIMLVEALVIGEGFV